MEVLKFWINPALNKMFKAVEWTKFSDVLKKYLFSSV